SRASSLVSLIKVKSGVRGVDGKLTNRGAQSTCGSQAAIHSSRFGSKLEQLTESDLEQQA
ncbi:hypothetical protein CBI55_26855, partial [Pseudomonas syringae]